LEKNKQSWVIVFAEKIAQGVDEAKKTAPPKRNRIGKRKSAGEVGEGSSSKRRKTSESAEPSIEAEPAQNLAMTGDESEGSPPAVSPTSVDQPSVQIISANTAAPSEDQQVPVTQSPGQDAASSTLIPLPQGTVPATAIFEPLNH
jgi:hypothetical protein